MTYATRFAFAALLFSSPWMTQWVDVLRRVPPVYSGYTDFFVYPSDLFLALTLTFGFLAVFVAPKKFQRGPWFLTLPLAALVGLSFASTLTGVDPSLTLYHSIRFLALFGLYLVLVNVNMPPDWVALPLVAAVMLQSAVAILQFTSQASLGLQNWGELMLDPAQTGTSILRIGDLRILRAYGLTDHPNLLGGLLAFALLIILGYYFVLATASSQTRRRARYLLYVPLLFGVVALFYSFSRSAQLAFALGVVVLLVALLREPTQRLFRVRELALLGVVGLLGVAAPIVTSATNQQLLALRVGQADAFEHNVSEARSLNERDVLTESANRIFYQRQFLGVGNGALPLGMFYLDPAYPKEAYDYQPAHFVVLVAAAELGLFGAFLWAWLMLAPLLAVWIRRAQFFAQPWAAALAAVMVMLLVVSFADYYTWLWQAGRLWQWSAWGLFAAVLSSRGVNE